MVSLIAGGGVVLAAIVVVAVLVATHVLGGVTGVPGKPSQPMAAVWLVHDPSTVERNQIATDLEVNHDVQRVMYVTRAQSTKVARTLPAALRPGEPTPFFLVHLANAGAARSVRRAVEHAPDVWAVKTAT